MNHQFKHIGEQAALRLGNGAEFLWHMWKASCHRRFAFDHLSCWLFVDLEEQMLNRLSQAQVIDLLHARAQDELERVLAERFAETLA